MAREVAKTKKGDASAKWICLCIAVLVAFALPVACMVALSYYLAPSVSLKFAHV